jgi:hypothetical protein
MMYAADSQWWRYHGFCRPFTGERWTQWIGSDNWAQEALDNGLRVIKCRHACKLSLDPAYVNSGHNSGFQALNIAILRGAKRILLLGVDLTNNLGAHWFGEHPPPLNRASPFKTFIKAFEAAAPVCQVNGIEVINCSPTSVLTCFPKRSLEDAVRECITA